VGAGKGVRPYGRECGIGFVSLIYLFSVFIAGSRHKTSVPFRTDGANDFHRWFVTVYFDQ